MSTQPKAPETRLDSDVADSQEDILARPLSTITDGWRLKDGCLYLMSTQPGTNHTHTVIVRLNGCTAPSH